MAGCVGGSIAIVVAQLDLAAATTGQGVCTCKWKEKRITISGYSH